MGLLRQGLHQRLERRSNSPGRAAGLSRDGLHELPPERFPVAAECIIDDGRRQAERRAIRTSSDADLEALRIGRDTVAATRPKRRS